MMAGLRAQLAGFLSPFFPIIYREKFSRLLLEIDEAFEHRPEIVFIFPAYHMGGAEKVHLQIMDTVQDRKTCTIIAHKSASSVLKSDFSRRTDSFIDLGALGNYSYFRRRVAKLVASKLNAQQNKATVFGCNATLFYDVIDQLQNKKVRTVDLIHAFSPYIEGIENRALLSIGRLDFRVTVNQRTVKDFAESYRKQAIQETELNKIRVIYNPLDCTEPPPFDKCVLPYGVLWVGRGSPEKRPWLFEKIANEARKQNLPFRFSMVGDVVPHLQDKESKNLRLFGPVYDATQLSAIYKNHCLLFTTSVYEGFPLTISEAVCHGLLNVSTAVGGIPEHIQDGETGYLIEDSSDEQEISSRFIEVLRRVSEDPEKLSHIPRKAWSHFSRTFSLKDFTAGYRKILIHD